MNKNMGSILAAFSIAACAPASTTVQPPASQTEDVKAPSSTRHIPQASTPAAAEKDISLLYNEASSPKDVMAVYGHGAWRSTSPVHLAALAQRSHCPPELLAELATHDNPLVRSMVGATARTPIQSLERLAMDRDEYVRMQVLTNKSSTPTIIRTVVSTQFTRAPAILFVHNAATPEDVLAKLTPEEILSSHPIQRALAEHPNLPKQLAVILSTVNDNMTKRSLAANPSCPVEILVAFASDQDPNIVAAVAANPSTPESIAEMARRKILDRRGIH